MTDTTEPLMPKPGTLWRSRDRRDDGLAVEILAVAGGRVRIRRFNVTTVRLDRFHRDYEPVVRPFPR